MHDTDYWARQQKRLAVVDREIRHVHYAKFVADQCANNLRFVEGLGWYRWSGAVWQSTGDDGAALQAITDAAQVIARRIAEHGADAAWGSVAINKLLSGRERGYLLREMAALREFRSSVDDFDAARHLLTFTNGTVDLRTGTLMPHEPAHMQTLMARVAYRPDAAAPRWLRFVEDVFPGDADLQRYYQTWLGLCITGEAPHVIGVWYGEKGRNGKGTTIRTMQAAFGNELILDVPFEHFKKGGYGPHSEEIADLRNARMLVVDEGEGGTALNVTRLKSYSGGDRIQARKLRQATFRFDPKFTITMTTNELPEFAAGGAALWARTKAVLFGQTFAGREDRTLEPTIQGAEAEGVAAWVVEGAKRYYAEGLIDPVSVELATAYHKDEVDPLKPLIGELFEFDDPAEPIARSTFNAALKKWRDVNGDNSGKFKPASVHKELERRGIKPIKVRGTFVLQGLRMLMDQDGVISGIDTDGPGIFSRDGEGQ